MELTSIRPQCLLLNASNQAPPFALADTVASPSQGAAVEGAADRSAVRAAAESESVLASNSPRAGAVVGPYRLDEPLQRGPVHWVFRGTALPTGQSVVVKILQHGSSYPSAPERLCQEWTFLREMEHANIVRAIDFIVDEKFTYLVLEYALGDNLETLVGRQGALSVRQAANYICQAARGMAHAHACGIIHRDLKPSNLCLTPEGAIKIIDFGVSFDRDAISSMTTEHGEQILGTVNYMAPEQTFSAHHVDARADIYALGATLHFLLSGHPPFPNGTAAERILSHRLLLPDSLAKVRSDLPDSLLELCGRMMAKAPESRTSSMEEVAGTLDGWLATAGA